MTTTNIHANAQISGQLRAEGASKEVAALAAALAKGQFQDAQADEFGAVRILMDALGKSLAAAPFRPNCCKEHERDYLFEMLRQVGAFYNIYRRDAHEKEARNGRS